MAALSANAERSHFADQEIRQYEVEANVKVFKGAFLGKSASGHAQPLIAANLFLGIAFEGADNTGGSDSGKKVKAYTQGDFVLPLTSVAKTNVGAAVYASSDNDVTLTSSGNSFIGHVVDVHGTNEAVVRLEVFKTAP